uniref:Uncharacterized protein n=1 Tax=Myoviridae sp. ctHP32 TaxID=2823539 RepID=A0A8S5LFM8_9CAUD|nr:MAG TPA: hypothetical protein [Myoviridae sp. ctHP32]
MGFESPSFRQSAGNDRQKKKPMNTQKMRCSWAFFAMSPAFWLFIKFHEISQNFSAQDVKSTQ